MNRRVINKINRSPALFAKDLKVTELVSILKELDDKYHNSNKSVVTDEAFDTLREILQKRSPNNAYLKQTGAPVKVKRNKVKLPFYMPSLDKGKPGTPTLTKWLQRTKGPFVLLDKLDGISLAVVYDKGVPTNAYLRGNGRIGHDISHHIQNLRIPKKIPIRTRFAVRCEVIMNKATFDAAFSKTSNKGKFENARNMAGGVLNKLSPDPVVSKFRTIVYEIIEGKGANTKPSKQLALARSLGFSVVANKVVAKIDEPSLIRSLELRKKNSKTAIDGLVVIRDAPYSRVQAGFPEYAIAFKMNTTDSMVETTVIDVEWNVSQHGKLVPTVLVKSVRVGDITVNRVSGHNAYFILHGWRSKDKKQYLNAKPMPINKGTKVLLVRSGDVIPHIVKVVKPSRYPSLPDVNYTVSKSGIDFYSDEEQDSENSNLVEVKQTVRFFDKLDIPGIKSGVVTKLLDNGMGLKEIIHASVDDFNSIPGFKDTSSKKLYDAIHKGLKSASIIRIADASGAFGEGIGQSRIVDVFEALPNILTTKISESALISKLVSIEGIQENTATKIARGIPKLRAFLLDTGIKPSRKVEEKALVGSTMDNENVAFTRIRDKPLQEWIISHGGTIHNTVKKDTTILITKDNLNTSSKETKARDNGVSVLTLAEFYNKYKVKI